MKTRYTGTLCVKLSAELFRDNRLEAVFLVFTTLIFYSDVLLLPQHIAVITSLAILMCRRGSENGETLQSRIDSLLTAVSAQPAKMSSEPQSQIPYSCGANAYLESRQNYASAKCLLELSVTERRDGVHS